MATLTVISTKPPIISREEFFRVCSGLKKAGWEHTSTVMDDCGTGGMEFKRGEERFFWNQLTHQEALQLAGLK